MPRIVPIQLLKCLKVLLDDNGGILSAGEVKRLASLMTKYSKKLVSKCIYVQILKCTKTELLGEFMGAGGWSLVYTWLNDAIRAMNWPLVQEILELLLLCPVDVNRLKINSAPKLVKGLCKDGGNEGVRILAKRLVEQWLKVVTENPEATLPNSATTTPTTNMTPQATSIKAPPVAVVAPMVTPVNIPQTSLVNTTNQTASSVQQSSIQNQTPSKVVPATKADDEEEDEEEPEDAEDDCPEEDEEEDEEEQDPLGGVQEPIINSYSLTPAQKKASESGLVYKIVVKNGNQFLAKVPKTSAAAQTAATAQVKSIEDDEDVEATEDVVEENDADDETDAPANVAEKKARATSALEADDNNSTLDKPEKENDSNSGNEEENKLKSKSEGIKKSEEKKSLGEDKEKSSSGSGSSKDGKSSSKDKERRSSNSSMDKERDRDSKSSKTSSSSSSHRSSSHKSSSSSKSSSSASKSKSSSSSSSSSHRSSSDKHKSDKEKERSSSSKDKDRSGSSSSSSSKHRSSSSKSSSSSSSSSKDKYREKDKSSSGSSSSSKNRDKDRDSSIQSDKDKNNTSSSDKLGKISKKSKDDSPSSAGNNDESGNKSTSITIPSKKASMSIEIRKDTEKTKTVKTYKSQFRSHGLTEEAPPPPSRKGLKKPSSTSSTGSILPTSLPSSLKRTSPPPRDSPTEKKPKIDMNSVAVVNEKPGAIKLIPPKKIQTLVETNLFSDALSAATGPKKIAKRKRSNTPAPTAASGTNTGPSPPTSPEAQKVMPLKFYQDTLDESKTEDSKSDKENEEQEPNQSANKSTDEDPNTDKENDDDDDDIPLKKVKEDIEQKVAQEKKMDLDANVIDITKDGDETEESTKPKEDAAKDDASSDNANEVAEAKKPGPGCGPNGPPGVLMLHRRKGPKKKLTWRPQETLEQIRYFELDENERVNVTKTSFMDMKNLERFNERDAIVLARRGFNQEDNMEPQTSWKPLVEVDDVPPHPEGNQSKQRKIQAEREMTTLRALYFTHALIPDSPAEAEIEPIFNHDVPLIPLDDLTGNPDAVNDFTSMPWPEPRGSPKHGESSSMAGTGGLGSPVDMFGGPSPQLGAPGPNNGGGGYGGNPFNPIISPFSGNPGPSGPPVNVMPSNNAQGPWQRPPNGIGCGNAPMMGNPFNNNHGSPIMDMGGPPRSMGGGPGPGHMMNNGPPQNFNNQFGANNNNNNPFAGPVPMNPFGVPAGNNFGVMGPGGPMVPPHMMNGMGPGPMMGNNGGPSMMNGPNNRNNGGNWRSGGPNFQDNNGGGNWRSAGPGPNNRGGNGGGNSNNNGICKAFMRGHCRVGKSCKFIHPSKNKRI